MFNAINYKLLAHYLIAIALPLRIAEREKVAHTRVQSDTSLERIYK